MQQICQNVLQSQLFERIRFEANLALQDDHIDDEERIFSAQAQEFLHNFQTLQYLLSQQVQDS